MRSRKKEENNTQKQNRNSQSQTKARDEREREGGEEGKRNSQRGSRAELKRRAMRRHVVIFRKKSPQPWPMAPPVPCAHKANDESWRSWRKQASVDASSNSSWSSSDSSSSGSSKSRLAKRAALISSRNSNNNISKTHSCCCCCNCCCCCCCYCDRLTTRLADILAARSHSKAERESAKRERPMESKPTTGKQRSREAAMKNQFRNVTTTTRRRCWRRWQRCRCSLLSLSLSLRCSECGVCCLFVFVFVFGFLFTCFCCWFADFAP